MSGLRGWSSDRHHRERTLSSRCDLKGYVGRRLSVVQRLLLAVGWLAYDMGSPHLRRPRDEVLVCSWDEKIIVRTIRAHEALDSSSPRRTLFPPPSNTTLAICPFQTRTTATRNLYPFTPRLKSRRRETALKDTRARPNLPVTRARIPLPPPFQGLFFSTHLHPLFSNSLLVSHTIP